MLDALIRRFVKQPEAMNNAKTREEISVLAGVMGIAINLILFAVKLPIGLVMGSIAITSDAFNNISDMGSSLISVIGARMAGKRPDAEHPFGHGRVEYVSALIVAFMIFFVGIELFRESAGKLMNPEDVRLNPVLLVILGLSIALKLWMYYYNRVLGKRINSAVLRATASDSINDVITTAAVVLATAIDPLVGFSADGVAGIAVSLLILYSGFETAKDTITLLLGGKPDPVLMREVIAMVSQGTGIVGVHDLIMHDYGPGRQFASIHAEVPADGDFVRLHEMIDEVEQRVQRELNVPIVIHMDPISLYNDRINALRDQVLGVVTSVESELSIHDFRMTDGENRVNLIFDLVVPSAYSEKKRKDTVREIARRLAEIDPRYRCVIQVDQDYLN